MNVGDHWAGDCWGGTNDNVLMVADGEPCWVFVEYCPPLYPAVSDRGDKPKKAAKALSKPSVPSGPPRLCQTEVVLAPEVGGSDESVEPWHSSAAVPPRRAFLRFYLRSAGAEDVSVLPLSAEGPV